MRSLIRNNLRGRDPRVLGEIGYRTGEIPVEDQKFCSVCKESVGMRPVYLILECKETGVDVCYPCSRVVDGDPESAVGMAMIEAWANREEVISRPDAWLMLLEAEDERQTLEDARH
mgnify:CR=1|jgi:hypothetical protein